MKKVALITGASKGIGAATALTLAQKGYAVCINYHNSPNEAELLVNKIKQENGKAIAIKADMANEQDILKLFNAIDEEFGTLTALVNNAGANGGIAAVEEISLERLHHVFSLNVYGTFIACREAIKRMKQNKQGAIVNVTSEAAKFGGTKLTHYAASKAAINTFTIGFAREAAPYHIRVNAVSPGVINTDIHHGSSPERLQTLINSLPMNRMGDPKEVSELIYWLLSDAASYVSGAVIPISGAR